MRRKHRAVNLPSQDHVVKFLGTLTGPATVSRFTYHYPHVPSSVMRAYLRPLAVAGVLFESKNDSETLQFSLPPALTGLTEIYQPVLPTCYTSRMVIGVMGRRDSTN